MTARTRPEPISIALSERPLVNPSCCPSGEKNSSCAFSVPRNERDVSASISRTCTRTTESGSAAWNANRRPSGDSAKMFPQHTNANCCPESASIANNERRGDSIGSNADARRDRPRHRSPRRRPTSPLQWASTAARRRASVRPPDDASLGRLFHSSARTRTRASS